MYKLIIRPILFYFPPESVHHFVMGVLKYLGKIKWINLLVSRIFIQKDLGLERTIWGIKFPNPVGLAAGFDKDAKAVDALASLGFGHIEIGTVTPLAQPGNPQPRLFRLPQDKALINRMGFNNDGCIKASQRLKERQSKIIVGGNIGKNKLTPNENATSDYIKCFHELYPYVDYFVVNVSSPNTPGLRALQDKEPLMALLSELKKINASKEKPKPILLKIAPDLTNEQLDEIIEIVLETKTDGIVATNTTISRDKLSLDKEGIDKIGTGGLSGRPLTSRSTEVIQYLHSHSNGKIPLIAAGGIMNADDAMEKLKAGARLVQLYTGFIYEGPSLIRSINKRYLKEKELYENN